MECIPHPYSLPFSLNAYSDTQWCFGNLKWSRSSAWKCDSVDSVQKHLHCSDETSHSCSLSNLSFQPNMFYSALSHDSWVTFITSFGWINRQHTDCATSLLKVGIKIMSVHALFAFLGQFRFWMDIIWVAKYMKQARNSDSETHVKK